MPTNLSDSQIKTAQNIAQYGQDHGFSKVQIDTALKTAFIESSLGVNRSNGIKGNTATGLYGYTDNTWKSSGNGGDKNNDNDQIQAFYNDMKKRTDDYNNLPESTRKTLSLDQYLYMMHHDGPHSKNYTDSSTGKQTWDKKQFTPPPSVYPPAPPKTETPPQSPSPDDAPPSSPPKTSDSDDGTDPQTADGSGDQTQTQQQQQTAAASSTDDTGDDTAYPPVDDSTARQLANVADLPPEGTPISQAFADITGDDSPIQFAAMGTALSQMSGDPPTPTLLGGDNPGALA